MTTTETPELVYLHPDQVALHPDNIRDATRDLKGLAASIKEVGMLVPLIVVPVKTFEDSKPVEAGSFPEQFPEGTEYVAVDGNRRKAAAAMLADKDMPNIVMRCLVARDMETAAEMTRTMAVTGLVRDGLTARETATAVQAMLDLGLSQAAVARSVGWKSAQVKQAKAAAAAIPLVTAEYDLTLDQLAAIGEFPDDEEARESLIEAAGEDEYTFEHELARRRKAKERQDRLDTAAQEWADLGYTVLRDGTDRRPSYRPGFEAPLRVQALRGTDGAMTGDEHRNCPHRGIWLAVDWQGTLVMVECCTDPSGHELLHPEDAQEALTPATSEALAEAEAQAKERATQERREVRENNRDMLTATEVRRAFVLRVLGTKKHHKAIAAWALAQVVAKNSTYAQWVGSFQGSTEVIDPGNTPDGLRLWSQVCSAYEEAWAKDCWRQGGRMATDRKVYLDHLVSLGYTLSRVELIVMGEALKDEERQARWNNRAPAEVVVDLPDEDTTTTEPVEDLYREADALGEYTGADDDDA